MPRCGRGSCGVETAPASLDEIGDAIPKLGHITELGLAGAGLLVLRLDKPDGLIVGHEHRVDTVVQAAVDARGDGLFQGRASSFMEYERRNRLRQEIAAAGLRARARQ